ncbi:MAG: hypothetical protein OEX19_08025 [Gammaproteobacteria bacterium]|nr:hypothetical protein [Gammaproteobacteria bacterium]
MINKKFAAVLSGAVLCASTVPAFAGDTQVTGFLRAAGAMTTGDSPYLERIDKNGNTGDTNFGVNVAREIDDRFKVAGQLWASGSEGGTFEMVLDWAYATVNLAEGMDVMAGKIKYPNLIVSEYVDVGITYPWVRPPQEVYSFDAEERPNTSLESFVGGSALYRGFAGDFDYSLQVYGGETGLEGGGGTLSKMLGAKLRAGSDMYSLHGGYNMHLAEGTGGEKDGKTVSTISAGLTADVMNVVLYSEYVMGAVADEADLDTTSYYATLGYRIGSIMPHVTYAALDAEEGRTSITAGIKYQMSSSSTLKMDFSQVTPSAEEGEEAESFNVASVALDIVF